MPGEPILDAHVHLWDPGRMPIPWLGAIPQLRRRMDLGDYRKVTAGLPVEALVYLQVEVAPPYALIEAKEIAALAASEPIIAGIVPWAPLEDGDLAAPFLRELASISYLVKGVRRITQDEPDPDFCLRPGFIRGVSLLPEYGLSCDLCCRSHQLGPTIELVRQAPQTDFILDHIGNPPISTGEYEPWNAQIRELASLPNVVCKVSGVVTNTAGQNWKVEEIRPYVLHVLDCFGEDRVVFGSDWPVVTLASTYRRWYDALQEITLDFSAGAKRKLWWENGRRFYRLDD